MQNCHEFQQVRQDLRPKIKTILFESQIPLSLKNQLAGSMAETRIPKFKLRV